jgi:hypothetical protein
MTDGVKLTISRNDRVDALIRGSLVAPPMAVHQTKISASGEAIAATARVQDYCEAASAFVPGRK